MLLRKRPANRTVGTRRLGTDLGASPTKEEPSEFDALMARFGFKVTDLADARIRRALARKFALDTQIKDLIESGAMSARVRRVALLMGWTERELADDPRISWLVKVIIESRQYLLTLRPPRTKPETTPATPVQE